ncbi:hypothetical protein E3O11_03960 [Cryobacterium levicorallinum]|uniref:DUF8094 domain-containing protein n=1 Tax=Cryobacterium levicorallinum TaxID=995038 RepID=A0A1I3AAH5_9MICO|nr:hypothetical protein [Cryobacterium levicorallinum]TFB86459.1 hypothetical protein E3O11_03960 [Cryobacterium levicorallinum]GEP26713.1 hypothetical protein CLE01_13110 [Cryobacterium levicorallinum]SFH47074.1 hypothetical protein SAMN05216274_1064 [Cryobacterium levicorallinum]
MRFVLAIVAFVLAAVMIVLGIAQRTILLEPAFSSLTSTATGETLYTVIDPSALAASPGSQTINVRGEGPIFLAYGRSEDVAAWIGDDAYATVALSEKTGELTSTVTAAVEPDTDDDSSDEPVAADAAEPLIVNPAGSDLWLEEVSDTDSLTTTQTLPEGISVLVASDGVEPAPANIRLSWASDNSTPWAGPLLAGGALLLLFGLVLYLLALLHLRRSRRPRRNVPRGPRLPRLPRAPRPKAIKASQITSSRRGIARRTAILPMILVSGLALSGCSADLWPDFSATTTETATPTPTPVSTDSVEAAAELAPPAVTVPQLEIIMGEISLLTADADATLNADTLATRFTGPALEQRLANYAIRAVDATVSPLLALPGAPLTFTLPQQTNSWPRVVMTVIQNETDAEIPPTAIILQQESPRANYLIEYAFQLEPAARVPEVAPALIGAPAIAPDNKLLLLPPNELAAAYADVLLQGAASPSVDLFEDEVDAFRAQFDASRADRQATLPATASIEFGTAAGDGSTVALATNDSGSIVAVSVNETEIVKPINDGATVSPSGAASKALSGISSSSKGILNTYSDQLLFYVPTAGSSDKIILLGFAQGLTQSAELP